MEDDVFGIVGSLQAGAFQVKEVVAEGGFAVIYRAHHEGFRADVALKCLKLPGLLTSGKQQEFLEKFRAEGEVLFRLSAAIAAVVRPLHLGTLQSPTTNFAPFIALEWLEGENLDSFIRGRRASGKPPIDLRRAVQLLAPAARAIEQAHRFPSQDGTLCILHRDLKPENVFVAKQHGRESVKVLDFGIGKVRRAATQMVGQVSLDQSSFNAFTPAYAAPEQWLPKRFGQTGTWTDVWGFALTLVEVLTHETPLDGDAHAVMGAAMDETRRPTPRALGCVTSDAVEAIFQRALAIDPRERYHDIGEFWDHLELESGLTTTRLWSSPASPESAPPRERARERVPPLLERQQQAEAGAYLELGIPDLDASVQHPGPPSAARRSPASVPSGLVAFDEFSDLDASAADSVPNIGGFRIDPPGDIDLSPLELETSPRELCLRPRVAQYVGLAPPPHRSLVASLAGPLKLLLLAAAIMAADWVYTVQSGETLQLGPARAFWVAGPLAVYAVVKIVFRLLEH